MSPSGSILCTPGVAIARRDWRETDRIATIYTLDLGKVPARFMGVNRPRGKLKAFSEPMVWAEYRLHVRPGAEYATVLGGSLFSTFPRVRASLECTLRAWEICELFDRMTPFWQPNPVKYALISDCFGLFDKVAGSPQAGSAGADWIAIAVALRLFKAAGFGVAEMKVSEGNRVLWEMLHEADLPTIGTLPGDAARQGRLAEFIARTVERLSDRPLRSARLRQQLAVARGAEKMLQL